MRQQSRPAGLPVEFDPLIAEIRACDRCARLPLGPNPVVRGRPTARLLIISQAPGTRAHQTGLSFNDRSGDRLRLWLGLDRERFYDEARVALMPIGFCYPGRDPRVGRSGGGDLPPRPECAPLWHPRLRPHFADIGLTLLVGSHAIRHYLPERRRQSLSEIIAGWRDFLPDTFVLPHPSWRTTHWERTNPLVRGRTAAVIARRHRRRPSLKAQPSRSIRSISSSLKPK
jgi:uracil-DNA glycosylase